MISRFPLSILVGMAAAIWALTLSGHGWVIPPSFFTPLSFAVSALSVVLLVFDKWAWAWPGIRLFTQRPDLRGTWEGLIQSGWEGSDGSGKIRPIKAYFVIHQTYMGLHLRLLTQESNSITLAASLMSESDAAYMVTGVYRNVPKHSVRERSPMHFGGLLLHLEGPPLVFMSGHYWTDRKSHGEIELKRMTKKRVEDFKTAEAIATRDRANHPVLPSGASADSNALIRSRNRSLIATFWKLLGRS